MSPNDYQQWTRASLDTPIVSSRSGVSEPIHGPKHTLQHAELASDKLLFLVNRQVVIPRGQAQKGQRGAIDPALAGFRAIRPLPKALRL